MDDWQQRIEILSERLIESAELLMELAEGEDRLRVITVNSEIAIHLLKLPRAHFDAVLRGAVTTVDGAGFAALLRAVCPNLHDFKMLRGSDITQAWLKTPNSPPTSIRIIGGREESVRILQNRFRRNQQIHLLRGDFKSDGQPVGNEFYAQYLAKPANVDLIALGFPKGEWLAMRLANVARGGCLRIQIGGSLDFAAGTVPRAPAWMVKYKLEWLHRLLMQPARVKRTVATVLSTLVMLAAIKVGRPHWVSRLLAMFPLSESACCPQDLLHDKVEKPTYKRAA